MNENVILNDFLQLKEDGVITEQFATYEELLDVLSGRFSDIYDNSDDAQKAFDDLDDSLNGYLTKHCGVYSLGTEEWDICFSTEASDELLSKVIQDWNNYYTDNISTIHELCSSVYRRVRKDMSNCGCDVHNALSMLGDDVFSTEHPFYVELGEENPRISFLE